MRRVVATAVLAGLLVALPGTAHAGDQEKTVTWNENWPRVHLVEVLNIVALTIGSVMIHQAPYHKEAKWDTAILVDKPVRNLIKLRTASGQDAAADVSDFFYKGMVLAPYVIDNYFVTLGIHQNADVALQMTLINMQSLGISGVLSLGAQHGIGRSRPYVRDCNAERQGPTSIGFNTCGDATDNQSFYSGHAAATFTMAGLTCVHHQHLPLYGGGLPDKMACAVMLAGAATTGITRMMADRHWVSDVVLGTAIGLFNGYFLPLWLHYGFGSGKPLVKTAFRTPLGTIAPMPQLYQGGAGLGVALF